MADYIVNLNKKDSSITLQKVERNITLVKQEKQIVLEHVGRRGEKGDKGDPGTGTNDYNELINKPFIPDELSELADDATHRTVTDTEKTTWNAKQNTLTADVDYLTPTTASSTYEPLLPATPVDPEQKFLNGNRQFAPISIGGGGFAANLYYTTIPSDVAGYYKLSYTAQATETILSGVVRNNEVLFRTYLFDDKIDTSVIDSGVWGSVPWLYVSNAAGITRVKIELFVRHIGGTETTLFSGYTEEVNSLVRTRFKSEITQSSFTVDPTDRLGARVYGTTTSNANITIYSVIGDGNASYFTTPIRIRHNQLRDLNGDPEYQHMTSAEKIILDNTSGTNTGDNATNTQYSGLETSKLNINQTSPQTTVGNFRFPNVYTPATIGAGYFLFGATNYGMAMGNTAPYKFGVVQDYSLKFLMDGAATRGWTWGGTGATPIAALDISGNYQIAGLFYPKQSTTAAAPAYVKGAIYFDTTLNKLRVGGATAWETITSV